MEDNDNGNGNGNNDDNTEKVLILPLNEDSKKITQLLSNNTALKILELLAQKPLSATAIADEMGMALTTIKYNLDALIESDLIKINKTRWSKKGREMKIYEPIRKLIVVFPGGGKPDKTSVMNMLQKYLGMICAAVFASFGIEYLAKLTGIGMGLRSVPETGVFDSTVGSTGITHDVQDTALVQVNDTLYESASGVIVPANETSIVAEVAADEAGVRIATESLSMAAPVEMEMAAKDMGPVSLGVIDQGLVSHIGLWFFFGCMFIILFLLVRELYYRKKSI
ncbi:MAG: ArsR/SmtB family transcription factor [Methanosarcinaceae archaeon]